MKIFALSTLVGAVAGVLGWAGAGLIKAGMGAELLTSIPWGWTGLMVGTVAVVAVVLSIVMDDLVDPIMLFAGAASGAALLWERQVQEIGIASRSVSASYWVALTLLGAAFVMLVVGLRGARMTAQRYRQ